MIANLRPSGEYLMEDFYYRRRLARAASRRSSRILHLDALTVTGHTLGENIDEAEVYNDDVIRPLDKPDRATAAAPRSCAATSRPTAA